MWFSAERAVEKAAPTSDMHSIRVRRDEDIRHELLVVAAVETEHIPDDLELAPAMKIAAAWCFSLHIILDVRRQHTRPAVSQSFHSSELLL